MRTNIDIDDKLMGKAMKVTGLSTKRETVEEGLKLLVRMGEQEARNLASDSYGIERIEEVLRTTTAATAADLRDAIARDVAAFRGEAPQDDDLTIVVARIT